MYRTPLIAACSLFILSSSAVQAESGLASYYGGRGHGMTCAHRTRAMGSILTVTTRAGRSIQCRVNDRGPFVRGRVIDVSVSAARALGIMRSGVVLVSVN
jgi:rare lipoprotein A